MRTDSLLSLIAVALLPVLAQIECHRYETYDGYCGDDELSRNESCDDGPANSDTEPGACRTDCQLAWCGDGVLDPGEACEIALDPGCKRWSCTLAVCGDAELDPLEACDDGPANSDTEPGACRSDCTVPFCGDGVIDATPHHGAGLAESCDDGNTLPGDGCSADCFSES